MTVLHSEFVAHPKRSKYLIVEAAGSKSHTLNGIWDQRTSNIGYLDCPGHARGP